MPKVMMNGRLADLDDGAAFLEAARGTALPDDERVLLALQDARQAVTVQLTWTDCAAVIAALGLPPSTEPGVVVTALRRLGVDRVFDAGCADDLAAMETAAELLRRLQAGGPLPLIAGGCPHLVAAAETHLPALLPHLSTCRSPQQLLGSLVKNYYAGSRSLPPDRVCCVAVAACPAKRNEAQRPEFSYHGMRDVDVVLSAAALAALLRRHDIDPHLLPCEPFSAPFGLSTGRRGGQAEAILRTAWFLHTGEDWTGRDLSGMALAGRPVRTEVLHETASLVEHLRRGTTGELIVADACPCGCAVPPGGEDEDDDLPYRNAAVRQLYRHVLEAPGSEVARAALHTTHTPRQPAGMPPVPVIMPLPRSAAGR